MIPGLVTFYFITVVDVLSRLMKKATEFRIIEGVSVGRENVQVTHLQLVMLINE